MYYNTNRETGETLARSKATTVSQEEEIIRIFNMQPGCHLAPHNLRFWFKNVPLTSIRRALSNLEKQGKLLKTDRMVIGSYGKMVHTWRISERQLELPL
jgi:hypothetical protein